MEGLAADKGIKLMEGLAVEEAYKAGSFGEGGSKVELPSSDCASAAGEVQV